MVAPSSIWLGPRPSGQRWRPCGPQLIVSAAAYTAVDRAEREPKLAYGTNATGAGAVAEAATRLGVPIIHLSTDHVFDGKKQGAYRETDAPAPLNVYGASKLEGEIAVTAANPRHLILRTSWVYSPFGTNFVKTMLRLASARKEIAVVADQRGNPSSALDIAAAVLHAAVAMGDGGAYGTYHLAGSGTTSWADFARHVFSSSRARGGAWVEVRDIKTAEFPVQVPRPLNTQLSTTKFASTFGWTMPHWPQSLDEAVGRIFQGAAG